MGKARRALGAVCRRAATRRGAGHPVPPSGILVLSQDQDSLGGGFSARDAFSGNLTNFHLWVRALSPAQLHRARACAPPRDGLLRRWDLGDLDVTPSLLLRLPCPGTARPLAAAGSLLTSGLRLPLANLATPVNFALARPSAHSQSPEWGRPVAVLLRLLLAAEPL